MRLDKFLKNSRIIKRRTIASLACDNGRVKVNGKIAKSSTRLKEGDIIEVQFGERICKYKVTQLNDHAAKSDAQNMYIEL